MWSGGEKKPPRRSLAPASRPQHRHAVREQLIENLYLRTAEIRQRVMVYVYPAANPTISVVRLCQPLDLPRAAHSIHRRVQPQCHQDARVNRRSTRSAFHRADPGVQRREIHSLDERPHTAHGMLRPHRGLKVDGAKRDLITLRHQHPRCVVLAWSLRCNRGALRQRWEKRRLFVHGTTISY